jgi:hypothetical protein
MRSFVHFCCKPSYVVYLLLPYQTTCIISTLSHAGRLGSQTVPRCCGSTTATRHTSRLWWPPHCRHHAAPLGCTAGPCRALITRLCQQVCCNGSYLLLPAGLCAAAAAGVSCSWLCGDLAGERQLRSAAVF